MYVTARWYPEGGPRARPVEPDLASCVARLAVGYDGLVFFTAVGVAVRLLAPGLRGKHVDPAVVAVDDAGRFAVSVLSGHLGGGNALAAAVAGVLRATPVVTTASEAHGLAPLDLLGQRWGWRLTHGHGAKLASAALVNGERVGWVQDAGESDWWPGQRPATLVQFPSLEALAAAGLPGLAITDRLLSGCLAEAASRWIVYRPRSLVLGVGTSTGVAADEIEALARATLQDASLEWRSVREVATIARRLDEPGVVGFAERHALPLRGYAAAELAAVPVPHPSAVVAAHVGTPSVCEAAALLAAGGDLIVPKRTAARVTVAVARAGVERE